MDLLLHRGCACCAMYVAIFRRNHDVTALVQVFNMLNICLRRTLVATKRKLRNRRSYWTRGHVVGGLLSKTIRAKSAMGALCNQASPTWHKRRIFAPVYELTTSATMLRRVAAFSPLANSPPAVSPAANGPPAKSPPPAAIRPSLA